MPEKDTEGPDFERDYDSLTDKQSRVVDAIVEHGYNAKHREVADTADCDYTYVGKVKQKFGHIIDEELELRESTNFTRFEKEESDDSPSVNYHYGEEAQTDRSFQSLTNKQRRTVHAIVDADIEAPSAEVAREAGVSDSYVDYVKSNFPHIINDRRGRARIAASDGGEQTFHFELTESETWEAIRDLRGELSNKIFRQVHGR